MYDHLIVGAGLFGSVCARQLADAGKRVLVVEKRQHIGGLAYTEEVSGIQVHRYGAHIFHTNDSRAWDYLNRFAEFNGFVNRPLANYKGELYRLPFNMYTFRQMWGVSDPEEARRIISSQREGIPAEPGNLEEQAISLVGRDIYEKLVRGYTEKQWGRDCRELPAFIIKRLPLRFTFDDNYFNAKYQGIPVGGYTRIAERLLDGIEVRLGTDYLAARRELDALASRVIYTGPIDAYFGYCLGRLSYRTLRFETELLGIPDHQSRAVVNYTDRDTPYTRIIEHKWFEPETSGRLPVTVISREYSKEWQPGDEEFYPVNDSRNTGLYEQYRRLAEKEPRTVFGGRLGEYRYCDMDQVVLSALACAERELT
ncbi:MAG: UDP-galactopyranose mutase [Ruminococcus sp.]|nr:UDP-galactopyranose mutase [Ruminococcus sp.]